MENSPYRGTNVKRKKMNFFLNDFEMCNKKYRSRFLYHQNIVLTVRNTYLSRKKESIFYGTLNHERDCFKVWD